MIRVIEIFGEPILSGGQESFVINVVKKIKNKEVHIDLLSPYYCENSYHRTVIKERGGDIYTLGLEFRPGNSRFNIVKPINEFLNDHRYDVAHIHSGSISVLALASRCAKQSGVKKVLVHSHSGIEVKSLKNDLLRTYGYLLMKQSVDIYCACSVKAAEAKYLKNVVKKTNYIKNGVDISRFEYNSETRCRLRKKYRISDDTYVIGHVGRFDYPKNHFFLLDVFEEYHKENKNTKLMLVGEGGYFEEFKNSVIERNLENDVILVGNVEEVQDYYQAMDVFVLPSLFEGLPIVGVEAQAAGLQTLVSQNVSRELKISENVHYSKDMTIQGWIDMLKKASKVGRNDVSCEIKNAGYDIESTANSLEKLYLC